MYQFSLPNIELALLFTGTLLAQQVYIFFFPGGFNVLINGKKKLKSKLPSQGTLGILCEKGNSSIFQTLKDASPFYGVH